MAVGLRIWNTSGVLILDATHRIGRIKGQAHISGTAGSVAVNMTDGTPFWSFQPDFLYAHISNETPPPIITVDGNGVYWTYSGSGGSYNKPITGWVYYGVY